MVELVTQHRAALETLCRCYRVKTLELFGSALSESFDSVHSDLDFLVEFEIQEPIQHSKCYFGLLFAVESCFHRKIDLVETAAIRNSYLLDSINRQRRLLYAA